jgi:hypothetical protein
MERNCRSHSADSSYDSVVCPYPLRTCKAVCIEPNPTIVRPVHCSVLSEYMNSGLTPVLCHRGADDDITKCSTSELQIPDIDVVSSLCRKVKSF